MKKTICIMLTMTVVFFLLSGCTGVTQDVTVGRELGVEVLRCFDEKDSETLKSLFCEEVQNTHDLDKEIAEAMEIYSGKSVSYDNNFNGREGESIDNGEIIERHFVPIIDEIETNEGKRYKITFYYYLINEENENRVGINNIVLRDKDSDTRYIIGDSEM